ncbi:hypothetical protein EYC84_006849 [Monilinia fructicola]|uniref:Uncharacterized protein n=1 Tax=Monilinia fructicola TaxID=38448 RepID=A0A5M9K965_MONFR|nr:hypothetical protein EYC84_006849 [Monilinia fructicola]
MAKQKISNNPPGRDIPDNLLSHICNTLSGNTRYRTAPTAQSNYSQSVNATSTASVTEVDRTKYKVSIIFALLVAIILIFPTMLPNQAAYEPVSDVDTSTVCTAFTPPSTIVNDGHHEKDDDSSLNQVITVAPAFTGNAPKKKDGFIFKNAASGYYLGHSFWGYLICNAPRPDGWERFTARRRPEGGYHLLMTHWERLWKVGFKEGKLAKICSGECGDLTDIGEGEGELEVIVWEFIKHSNLVLDSNEFEYWDEYADLDRHEC